MKKSFLVTFGLICMVVLGFAFTSTPPDFKNLKVLPKDISEHELDSVMHNFSASLNVRCTFCHVQTDSVAHKFDFASDDNKHKLAAREMYRMMFKLNKQHFNETGKVDFHTKLLVTCYTCHHGNTEPATVPPPRERPQLPARDSSRRAFDSTRNNK